MSDITRQIYKCNLLSLVHVSTELQCYNVTCPLGSTIYMQINAHVYKAE